MRVTEILGKGVSWIFWAGFALAALLGLGLALIILVVMMLI